MEEGKEKPFQTVDKVILLLISIPKDVSTLVADLIALVPVVGQVYFFLDKLFSAIVWAFMQIYFFMKTGVFGRSGLVNMIGGMFATAGIPGAETASVLTAIYMANNPPEILKEVAIVGAVIATGGAGVPAAVGATGTAVETTTAASAVETTAVASKIGTAEGGTGAVTGAARTEEALAEKEVATGDKTGAPKKPETEAEMAASGETPEPAEELRKQLLEQTPQVPEKKEGDEEENMELADEGPERKTDGPKREML